MFMLLLKSSAHNLQSISDAKIRILDGTGENEGRVEIMYQGIWGTICDDGWDDIDASIACKELGFSHGNAMTQAQFGSGTGPVWLRQVGCFGNESRLSYCTHTGAGNTMGCSHAQDAGVKCIRENGNNYIINTQYYCIIICNIW